MSILKKKTLLHSASVSFLSLLHVGLSFRRGHRLVSGESTVIVAMI
jgi:hypothetical protein